MAAIYHTFLGDASFFLCYDTGNYDLVTGNVLFFRQAKKKAPKSLKTRGKPLVLGGTGASEDAKWVRPAKAVAFSALVTHISGVKITVH